MLVVAAIALSLVGPSLMVPQRSGSVPATRVYVTTLTTSPDSGSTSELVRCAASLKRALTPSLGTLLPTDTKTEADLTVELKKCGTERSGDVEVYEIECRLERRGESEDLKVRRTLTASETDEWNMNATAKALAAGLLRRFEPERVY